MKFYVDNFELKSLFKLSHRLGFANLDSQKSKLLSVLTLYYTMKTLQNLSYMQKLSKPETSWFWALSYVSWLPYIIVSIHKLFSETVLVNMYSLLSQFPFFDLYMADLSVLVIHDLQKDTPVNKFMLINTQTNKQIV